LACLGSGCADSRPLKAPTVSGTIESDLVRAASRYGGRVEKILAEEGAALKAGQLIAVLEAAELAARREQSVALLAELKSGPRPEEIAAARHEWEALQAELEFVNADDRRSRELFEQKAIAESERDRAATRARVLEKGVAAAKSRYDLLLAGTRPERLAQASAQVQEIDAQLREMKIVAPADCVLEVLHVKAGDVLAPNHPAATLILPQHTWVRVFVPEPWLGHVRLGQAVHVRVDSFPAQEFQGEVEQINREAEFTPRNVQTVGDRIKQVFGVKIRLSNSEDKLHAGMAADVIFPNLPGLTADSSMP
jgi:HlyD family secretion protein